MKTHLTLRALVAAILLGGAAAGLTAQDVNPVCPFGYEPGVGRTLDSEQRAQHLAALQVTLQELREKQAAGTLTAEEAAWLNQIEQRGGFYRTGTPRGPRGGQGVGQGLRQGDLDGMTPRGGPGFGQALRQGPRDGAGPRGGQGFGQGLRHGPRDGAGPRGGPGLRQGPRDGTGPRAATGTCPLGLVPPPSAGR